MSDSSATRPVEVPIVCSVCHTRLMAPASQLGQTIRCPDCHSPNRVVAPPPPPLPPPPPRYTGDEYRLRDEGEPAASASELVRLLCSRCSTMMYARVEHVGKRLKCPDCGTVNAIPAPQPTAAPFVPPDAHDLILDAAPPPTADLRRKEIADRLMAQAMEEVAQKESKRPQVPDRPLRSGIYRFLFYPSTLALWLLFAGGMVACLAIGHVITDVLRDGGYGSILAAFLVPVMSVMTIGLLGLAAPHFLTIIEHTADGHDRIPDWPSHDLLSRIRAILFWFNGLAMSTAPGMLAVTALRLIHVPVSPTFGLISTIVLFPAVMLSLLINNSVVYFYSPLVFRTFSRHRSAWLSFYAQTVGLAAVLVLFTVTIAWSTPEASTIADFCVLVPLAMYVTVYCRLLGRLAWVFNQDSDLEAAWGEDADDEADRSGLEAVVRPHR
jgi:DNA-directed RNA polymerase subunit RPC12/RpoP